MVETEWAKPPRYSDYRVSTRGKVRRVSTGRELCPQVDGSGRRYIVFTDDDGRRQNLAVGRLVLTAHRVKPPSPEHTEVIYKNGDLADDRITNIRWATRAEMVAAAKAANPDAFCHRANERCRRLAKRAAAMLDSGKATLKGIASKYEVPRSTLRNAIKRHRRLAGAA